MTMAVAVYLLLRIIVVTVMFALPFPLIVALSRPIISTRRVPSTRFDVPETWGNAHLVVTYSGGRGAGNVREFDAAAWTGRASS